MAAKTEVNIPREDQAKLWHESNSSLSLGCVGCPELAHCGGLQIAAPIFDCTSFCICKKRSRCDNVCKRNPANFVRRTREIKGFDLSNVIRTRKIEVPNLPLVVPVLYNGFSRRQVLSITAVALPLFKLFDRRTGTVKHENKSDVCDEYGIPASARIIATGTAKDRPLEAWWKLIDRQTTIRQLRKCGVDLISVPNFSLFSDVPRWDNMYNIKRIAIAWAEMQEEGMLAALHLNARTETDYARLAQFVGERSEITHVAFEFGTGAGWGNRIDWHVKQLCLFAHRVGRPLTLLLRGGAQQLRVLSGSFQGLVYLETDSFIKTHRRQRAVLDNAGNLTWIFSPTLSGVPLDDLMLTNFSNVQSSIQVGVGGKFASSISLEKLRPELAVIDTHH